MPSYVTSPFKQPPEALSQHKVAYLFGSRNKYVGATKMYVTNVALTSNVATLTVKILDGNIPAVGSAISIESTTTASGAFNVTGVALTGVTITASTGVGTVTFALTHANVASTADAGYATVPVPEVGETVANGASIAVSAPYTIPWQNEAGAYTVGCEVNFPTLPTACVVALQASQTDVDGDFQTVVSNVTTVSASVETKGTLQYTGKWNFFRYSISGTSGSGSIVAKLVI